MQRAKDSDAAADQKKKEQEIQKSRDTAAKPKVNNEVLDRIDSKLKERQNG